MNQKGFFVGVGAAGNKAVIELIEKGIITKDDSLLINSTLKDIPDNYRPGAVQLEGSIGGCGKERTLAKELTLKALKNGKLSLKDTITNEHALVVIIASTEGGTGSGAAPLIAKYYTDVVKIPTHVIAFRGFEEDCRGLQNTIEFFQDLNDKVVVQIIKNAKFIGEANGNKQKAEKASNLELCNRINVLLGNLLVDSDQNIDTMDIYKTSNTPGFMTIEYHEIIEKIKNTKEFNDILTDMLDSSKTVDTIIPSQKRLAAIINLPENERDVIDFKFSKVRERLGEHVFEYFTHIQYDKNFPKFIAFISSGMKMPIGEIEEVYEKYKKESNSINKDEDDFFETARELRGNDEDSMFDTTIPQINSGNEEDFFSSFIKTPAVVAAPKKRGGK